MRTIKAQPLTLANFQKYGTFQNLLDITGRQSLGRKQRAVFFGSGTAEFGQ